MIHKTRGIVFRFAKFRETSIIVSVFTESFGMQSYLVNGARGGGKGSGNKIALFQPLTLLDMVVYHRENVPINRIKETKCSHPYSLLTSDIRRTTISIFISEILNKVVKEESASPELFDFIHASLLTLDTIDRGVESFHLVFLLGLTQRLGFGPRSSSEIHSSVILTEDEDRLLNRCLQNGYEEIPTISRESRAVLLDCILRFYHEHIESLGEIKSVPVLRDILS